MKDIAERYKDIRRSETPTVQTTVFLNNRSQAVRPPKPEALPASVKEVDVVAIGNTRVISPAGTS